MKTIWLIRHGETEANMGKSIVSRADVPLTEQGHQQARQVASYLSPSPTLLVSSPFLRARQTADILHLHFPTALYEVWDIHEFAWLAPAKFTGLTETQVGDYADTYWERNDPDYVDGPDAESFRHFAERLVSLKTRLETSSSDTIALVSHGMFIRMFVWYLLQGMPPITPRTMRRAEQATLGFTIGNGGSIKAIIEDNGDWYFSTIRSL